MKGQETSGIIGSLSIIPHPEGCPNESFPRTDRTCHPFEDLGSLQAFLAGRWSSKEPCGDMECFERELHEYVVAAEREVLAEELARLDVDLPAVTIEGELYRQVVRCEESYVSAAGPVRVMRSLYRRGGEGERTLCPLELRAGIVEGRWTPLAARQAVFVVAHLTPQEGEDLFRELGNIDPLEIEPGPAAEATEPVLGGRA